MKHLCEVLSPFLPLSLSMLGSVAYTEPSQLFAWCTPNLLNDAAKPPSLFAVILLSTLTGQCHFFCSTERVPGKASLAEEMLVTRFIQSGCHAAADILRITHGSEAVEAGIQVASVHDKWASCLAPQALWVKGKQKHLRPPEPPWNQSPLAMSASVARQIYGLPPGATFSQLNQDDIETIMAASPAMPYQRPAEYLRACLPRSLGIKIPLGPNASHLVAWKLVHADGSVGLLHVDSNWRRRGLGRAISHGLTDALAGAARNSPTKGWFHSEVLDNNCLGSGFRRARQEGWVPGWKCYRIAMPV
jgi:hypothetical protein